MPGEGRTTGPTPAVTAIKIGYARVSTDGQDLTAQRQALAALGVQPDRVYVDHRITGTHRQRPGLREALAACRPGDTVVVTKLDRLARSVPDARDIVDELTATTNGSLAAAQQTAQAQAQAHRGVGRLRRPRRPGRSRPPAGADPHCCAHRATHRRPTPPTRHRRGLGRPRRPAAIAATG